MDNTSKYNVDTLAILYQTLLLDIVLNMYFCETTYNSVKKRLTTYITYIRYELSITIHKDFVVFLLELYFHKRLG